MKIIIEKNLNDFIENYPNKATIENELMDAIEHYLYDYFKVESTHNASLMLDEFVTVIELKITLWGE